MSKNYRPAMEGQLSNQLLHASEFTSLRCALHSVAWRPIPLGTHWFYALLRCARHSVLSYSPHFVLRFARLLESVRPTCPPPPRARARSRMRVEG